MHARSALESAKDGCGLHKCLEPTSTGIHPSACHDHREAVTGRRAPLPNPGACWWSSSVTAGWLERCLHCLKKSCERRRGFWTTDPRWCVGSHIHEPPSCKHVLWGRRRFETTFCVFIIPGAAKTRVIHTRMESRVWTPLLRGYKDMLRTLLKMKEIAQAGTTTG